MDLKVKGAWSYSGSMGLSGAWSEKINKAPLQHTLLGWRTPGMTRGAVSVILAVSRSQIVATSCFTNDCCFYIADKFACPTGLSWVRRTALVLISETCQNEWRGNYFVLQYWWNRSQGHTLPSQVHLWCDLTLVKHFEVNLATKNFSHLSCHSFRFNYSAGSSFRYICIFNFFNT